MNNTTIAQVLSMPDGTAIDSLQGTITEVYKQRTIPGGKTAQDAKIRDGSGSEIKLTIWEHPDCSMYKGKDVIIQSNKNGLKVKFDTYRPPGVNTVSVSKTCTFQFLEVHHAQTGRLQTNASAGGLPPDTGTGAKPPVSSQNTTGSPIVVNGAKIGMCVNNGVLFMTSAGEPFNSDRLHQIASEILKVSVRLENGEVA